MGDFEIEQQKNPSKKPRETLNKQRQSNINKKNIVKCNICNKSLKTNDDFKQHIELVHEGRKFK